MSVLILMRNLGISYVAPLPVSLEWGGPAWVSLLSPLTPVSSFPASSSLLPLTPLNYHAQALSLSLSFPIEITGATSSHGALLIFLSGGFLDTAPYSL